MYRPFLFFIVFFASGIILGSLLSIPKIFFTIAVLSILLRCFFKNQKTKTAFLAAFIFFLGAYYFNLRISLIPKDLITYSGTQQTLVGTIINPATIKNNRIIYDINVKNLIKDEECIKIRGKIRLSTDYDENQSILHSYGDIVKLTGKIKVPQGKRNPGGIDYRAYLLQKGISTTIYSREIEKIDTQWVNPFIKLAFIMREKISGFYMKNLPSNLSSLQLGILLGIKDNIPKDMVKFLGNSGVLHVFAVSGLHVGIIYGFLSHILKFFNFTRISIFSITCGFLTFYCYMVGLSASVIRATIMIIILMLGHVVDRESDSLNNLCISAAILLLINPLNLFAVSFQLSFAAVAGILLFFDIFNKFFSKLPKYLGSSLAVIVSAQILVFPFSAYYFNKVSLIGFLTNLLVVPIASLTLIIGFVIGLIGLVMPSLGAFLIKIPNILLTVLQNTVLFSSKIPYSTLIVPDISPIGFVLYFVFLFMVFDTKIISGDKRLKRFSATLLFVLILVIIFPFHRGLEVVFLDVGQGDSIFIRTSRNKTVLIDGGGIPSYYNTDFDTGADIVEPFLYSLGLDHIDIIVFTHFDEDHSKGLLSLLNNIKVGTVIYGHPDDSALYREMENIVKERNLKTLRVKQGDEFYVDELEFRVLNPPSQNFQHKSSNDNSVVLKMVYKNFSFLFTGDLEIKGEQDLIKADFDLKSNILKVGHHGSFTSTSLDFLSKVKPDFAIISVGENNSFGHPSPEVLERLQSYEVTILRTDFHGAVIFKIWNNNVNIYTMIPREL